MDNLDNSLHCHRMTLQSVRELRPRPVLPQISRCFILKGSQLLPLQLALIASVVGVSREDRTESARRLKLSLIKILASVGQGLCGCREGPHKRTPSNTTCPVVMVMLLMLI